MHLKRHNVPKKWPVHRKGTKYVVRPLSNLKEGLPLLVGMRDMLGLAQNRKEVKKAIHLRNILINKKRVTDDKASLLLFDVVTIVPSKKDYRLDLTEKGKMCLKEIASKESEKKVSKVKNKKILKGNKIQLNLSDGNNFISDIKCNTGDSVIINLNERIVEGCLPLVKGAKALVFAGKHAGKSGKIRKVDKENHMVELEVGSEKKMMNALIKQIIVTE